jgi:hypothetical protein
MDFETGVITEPKMNGTKVVAEVKTVLCRSTHMKTLITKLNQFHGSGKG